MKWPIKSPKKQNFTFEIIIIILIACCMIFLVNFANNKLDEIVTSDREALLMSNVENSQMREELARQIVQFRPDACKMIEVFSEDFELMFKVQFKDETTHQNILTEHEDLMNLLKSNKEGQTTIEIGDETEDVYFRWENTCTGEKCLIIIYMAKPIVRNVWVVSVVAYVVIVLVFILLLRMIYVRYKERVEIYSILDKHSSDDFL